MKSEHHSQNEMKVVLIDWKNPSGVLIQRRKVVIPVNFGSAALSRVERISALDFGCIVKLRKEHRMYATLYERTQVGNDERIGVNSVELVRVYSSASNNGGATVEEQINVHFEKLASNKHLIYEKNYLLIKPNEDLAAYLTLQQALIPKYIRDATGLPDPDSLSFLYLLIKNKRHTLLTDIINTRTFIKSK